VIRDTFNLCVASSDYPIFFRVIILPFVALCAGSARDLILLVLVKSRVEYKIFGKKGMLLQTAAPGLKCDTVMNNKQTRLRIFAFYEDGGHNLKIRSIRLQQSDLVTEVYAALIPHIYRETL
jgi:hypothetical protein